MLFFCADLNGDLQDNIKANQLKTNGAFYNVVYTKEWLDKLSYTEKEFKKFGLEELAAMGRAAGFENVQVKDIVKEKSFVVIYTK